MPETTYRLTYSTRGIAAHGQLTVSFATIAVWNEQWLEQLRALGFRIEDGDASHEHEYQHRQFWRQIADVDGARWFWVQQCVCGDELASLDSVGPLSAGQQFAGAQHA